MSTQSLCVIGMESFVSNMQGIYTAVITDTQYVKSFTAQFGQVSRVRIALDYDGPPSVY